MTAPPDAKLAIPRTESYTWRVRLSDSAPERLAVIVACAVAAFALGTFGLGRLLLGLAGFAMIVGATAEFWLGARYTLGPDQAVARVGIGSSAIAWSDVRRVLVHGEEVKLSPLASPRPLDPFRGVTFRVTPENRDLILRTIRERVGEDVHVLGG